MRIKAALGAFVTLGTLYLIGVLFLLRPVSESDATAGPLVPQLVGFLVSITLYIGLFVWIDRQMGDSIKAGLTVALCQLLLVDVDFVLSGDRGIKTAAASAVILLVSWILTGWVYGKLGGGRSELLLPDLDPQDP